MPSMGGEVAPEGVVVRPELTRPDGHPKMAC